MKVLSLLTLASLSLTSNAFAAADLKPTGIVFEEVAATGGEFPQDAYQKVTLKFKNVGDQAAGHTFGQICPEDDPDVLFCTYNVTSLSGGHVVKQMEYAVDTKQYLPGKSYTWEFGLAPHSLSHCQQVRVWLDRSRTAGQFGSAYVFQNDVVTLTAAKKGARLCALLP